jgi:hypothetical protein
MQKLGAKEIEKRSIKECEKNMMKTRQVLYSGYASIGNIIKLIFNHIESATEKRSTLKSNSETMLNEAIL